MVDNKDVDELYEELRNTLDKESKDEEPSVASDQEPQGDAPADSAADSQDEDAELSDEDISKLTPRAQKRIRGQAAEIARLAALAPSEPAADESKIEDDSGSQAFKTVEDFLSAVEDEPSRKLLETFYGVMKAENNAILSPIENANNKALFESEFKKYEDIEGLSDYKNDLEKTFLRNPKQSMKALIGETVLDLQQNRIKPLETTPSIPNRGKVDTSKLSKDELYDLLEPIER
jgi:hypothetical protein